MRTGSHGSDMLYHMAGRTYDPYTGKAPINDVTDFGTTVIPRRVEWYEWDQGVATMLRTVGSWIDNASTWLANQSVNNDGLGGTLAWWGATITSGFASTYNNAGDFAANARHIPQAIAAAYQRYGEMGIGWWDATVLTFNP